MNIRQTVRIPRRVLSLALCAAMVLTLLPLPARAEGICAHHPEHTADCGYQAAVEGQDCGHRHDDSCGYQEASPCAHSHDDVCGYREASNCTHQHTEECGENGESCVHSHDESCGYQEASPCTHSHDNACGYREARNCTHVHDDTCGYVEAAAGSPCTYRCELCAQQQNGQGRCTHGNDPAACEACASDARVASVQKLIDELPETVTEETAEAAQSALSAVDTAKSALTEAEQEKLNLTRYTALKELLAEPEEQVTDKVITDWEWVDDYELIDLETGLAHLPFVSAENIAYYDAVIEVLPAAITANKEELTLGDWLCEDYPMESGAYEGEYVFETTLPEGYTLADGTNVLRLTVVLGDPEGEPMGLMAITMKEPKKAPHTINGKDYDSVYEISCAEELYWYANLVNTTQGSSANFCAILTDDIVVNQNVLNANGSLNTDMADTFQVWTPMGKKDLGYSYLGKFDGQGHTISGLYVNDPTMSYVGLFGYTLGPGAVFRVGVVDSYFAGKDYVGGICGLSNFEVKVESCYTTATVKGNNSVGTFSGNQNGADINNCLSMGKIEDSSGVVSYGAFVGGYDECDFCCALSNTNSDGAKDSDLKYRTTDALATGEITYILTKNQANPSWRQTIGTHSLPQWTTKGDIVYCGVKDDKNYYHNHFGNEEILCQYCGLPTQNTDGSYYIKTKGQLYWFAALVNGTNGMTANPNAKARILDNITVSDDWVPIGNNTTFTGGFVGSVNRTISGIPEGSSLFGTIGSGVTIENLTIPSGSLCKDNLGTINKCAASGDALVGSNNSGTIQDCTASGGSKLVGGDNLSTIQDCSVSGGDALVGGSNSGTIADCSASDSSTLVSGSNSGTITGCTTSGGALVSGSNSGTIEKSYAAGSTGASLCATNNSGGRITNSYATATSGSAKLCGSNSGTIANCYAAGGSGTTVGSGGTITNCYALADSTASAVGEESITADDFTNGKVAYLLNKDDCWGQKVGADNADPLPLLDGEKVYYNDTLSYHNHKGYCDSCTAKPNYENGKWQITNVDELYWFAQFVNGAFTDLDTYSKDAILLNDITVNRGVLKPDGSLSDNSAGFAQWTPIGNNSKQYTGTFDGNNYTISGLYVNTPDNNYVGLFGCIQNATLKDLTIADSYLCGGMETGAVCGEIQPGSTVSNCHNTGTVVGTDYVGGVAGDCAEFNTSPITVTNCSNSGMVSGKNQVGGVCGMTRGNITISNCTNSGMVSGGDTVGGVCGTCNYLGGTSTVSNCTNSGTVKGTSKVGGVCGDIDTNGTVSNCANSGMVSGGSSSGGVCGQNKGLVEYCYNTASVDCSSKNNIGGVCGYNYSGTINFCYNTGAVQGDTYVGGVCGKSENGTITNCYNSSSITGNSELGGICGKKYSGTLKTNTVYFNYDLYKGSTFSGEAACNERMTTAQFASGEVAYLLNGSSSTGIWKQNIDVGTPDATPNFTSNTVYKTAEGSECPGYTNDSAYSGVLRGHNYEKHICTRCGATNAIAVTVSGITVKPKTYDGSVEAQLDTTNMTLSNVQAGDTVTVSATGVFDNANAGTGKTVTITLTLGGADSDKHYLKKETITTQADIIKKPVTAVVTVTPKTFDGTNTATVNAEVKEGLVSGDSITITGLTGTFDTATAGTGKTVTVNAAGKSITGTGATNYAVTIPGTATGTINKAQATITVAEGKDAYSKTYGDAAFQLEGITDNSSDADVQYSVSEGRDVVNVSDRGMVTILKAGEAYISLSLPESTNYLAAQSKTIRIDVAKKAGTVNITGNPGKTYDGQPATLTESMFSVTDGGGRTPSVEYKEKTAEDSAYTVIAPKAAGDYTLRVTLAGTDNYVKVMETKDFSIQRKPVTVSGITAEDKTYDGETTVKLNYNGVSFAGKLESDSLSVEGAGEFENANVGESKTVNITNLTLGGASKDNYTLSSTTATATATISPKALSGDDITVTLTGNTPVYDATEKNQGVTVTFGETTLQKGTDYTLSGNTGTDAGTYTLKVELKGNYSGSATKDWTITRAPITPVVTIANAVYGGTLNPSVSGNPGDGKVTYSYYSDAACTHAVTPKNVGTYYVKAAVAQTANYQGATTANAVSFQITQRPVTVSGITAEPKTYDGEKTATLNYDGVTFTGKLESDTLTVTGTGEFENANVGENKTVNITGLTLGGASKDNYTLSSTTATATAAIAKAASSVTKAPEDAKSLYSGVDVPLVTAGTAQGGTMMYRLGEDGPWTKLLPQAAAHGEYTVYYYVKGDGNHEDSAEQSLKARIRPFEITGQTEAGSIKYGESTALSVTLNPKAADVSGITYQWCQVTVEDGKEIFTPLEGETGSSLTLTKPNAGTYDYACIITCGDYSVTSDTAKVTVTAVPQTLPTTTDLPSDLWVEGGEKPLVGDSIDLKTPSSFLMTSYTYNGTSNDAHQNYPTGMQIYGVQKDEQGNTTVAPVAELGDLLRYSGCSIRITGKPGIRMITSLTKEAKAALTKANLAGYTLEEYGTVAVWSSDLDNQPLTLNTKKSRSNYAYKRGVSDPVFANVGALTQYTNVLVWDSLEAKKYAEDIVMRPYIKLSNQAGETVTLYGGTVSRSIGYVAQQNANTFAKGTAGYKYVHEIIDKVNALNSSTGTNTTTGGNG